MPPMPRRPLSRPSATSRWGPPTVVGLLCHLLLMGVCRGQTTPSPTAITTDDLLASPAPTALKCPDQLTAVEQCFANQTNTLITASTCQKCVVQYWPNPIVGCSDFVAGTCQGLEACDCGSCDPEVATYLRCLTRCKVNCDATPTSSPAPTASMRPTIPNKCPEQHDAFNNCVDPINGGAECENCLVRLWPKPLKRCTDIGDVTCPGLSQCNCNNCEAEWTTYLTCLTGGCLFEDCGSSSSSNSSSTISPAPTPHPCPDENAAVQSCLGNSGVSASECSSCIQQSFPQFYTECTDLDEPVCNGLSTCPCGNCREEILAKVNCAFETTYEKSCQIKCNGNFPPVAVPSGADSLAPAPTPGGGGSSPTVTSTSGAGTIGSSLHGMAGPLVWLGALWLACA